MRLFVSYSLTLVLAIPSVAATVRADRPNIVVILADDLGFSDLGCYGGEIETPNLDRLANGGLRYTQFYNTGRCWPTRAALLSGYYPHQIRRDRLPGMKRNGDRPAWAPLLPALLQPNGYRSYHSGKWHIDGGVTAAGFARSFRLADHGRFFHPQRIFADDQKLDPIPPGTDYYTTTAIADHAIECLQQHQQQHLQQPFFQFIAFTAPHFPLHALPADIEKYRDRYDAGWDEMRIARWSRLNQLGIVRGKLSDVERQVGPPYHFPRALERLGADEVNRPLPWADLTPGQQQFQARKMAIHAAMVDRMDQEIGRVLAQLQELQVWEDTLILFLSDNGASAEIMVRDDGHDPAAPLGSAASHLCLGPGWSSCCNTPFRRHKTWVHEGGIATPLIVHWPRGISARGELRHAPGHVIDVLPTIFALLGTEPPPPAADNSTRPRPGRSLAATFAADRSVERPYLWWYHEGHRAIRSADWKLVAAAGDPWELYDLSADRCETKNLAVSRPEQAAELAARWQTIAEEFRGLATSTNPQN